MITILRFLEESFPPVIWGILGPTLNSILQTVGPFFDAWILPLFKAWWWLPLPFILKDSFFYIWLRSRKERFWAILNPVVLEVKIPTEIEKPIKAMEAVMDAIWMVYSPPNPREKWIEGQTLLQVSFEIVGIDGETHFFVRVQAGNLKDMVESIIYSQYPDAEITEVEDYTKLVPQDIPNKDWDLWGTDYQVLKEDSYPLRTYKDFETGTEKEEKRVDPLASLLEGMAKLKRGEQLWVQINACPVLPLERDWVDVGKKLRDKLSKRPDAPEQKSILKGAGDMLLKGEVPEAEKPKEEFVIPPEMRLTPGEREVVEAIERKIGQYGFSCGIRFIYLGKRDVFFKPNLKLPMGFLNAYSTLNLNGLKPSGKTITKRKTLLWFWDKRKEYLRKRKLFKHYIDRDTSLGPRSSGKASFVLSSEELASFFHFPSRMVVGAPAVTRIEAKKGEAPSALPTE